MAAEDPPESRRADIYRVALEALRFAQSAIDRLEKDRYRLQRELASQGRQLATSTDLRSTSDVYEGGLGNRPALGHYRNTNLARLISNINELGLIARRHGVARARFALRTGVRADLALVYAAPPATVEEARRRDLVRVLVTNPASATMLAGDQERHERFREEFIALVLSSGVEASSWELIRRSAEERREGPRSG
ncbi:MAG: hypothetical protein L3J96_03950 [Thermoplasmata archaeon]|nr:hypothetical protein [Thermoplasmata archaeon]